MNEQSTKPEAAEKSPIVPINPDVKCCVSVQSSGGEALTFSGTVKSVNGQLRAAVLAGTVRGDTTATIQANNSQGQWTQTESAVRSLPQLDSIFRPARFRFVSAIGYGAMIGFSLEAAYQSWMLYQHYQTIAPVILFWLPVAFFLGVALDDALGTPIAKFLFPGITIAIFMGKGGEIMRSVDQISAVLAPTISALVVCAVNGTALGMSLAGSLAAIWVVRRGAHFAAAPDAVRESLSKYKAWAVILILAFAVLSVAYTGRTRHWPVNAEVFIRKDMQEHPPNRFE